ncbi:DUF1402 family protein [Pseudaminobacter sp. 19-2017]|uniref:DUF1402 family protein n=1 Tax=Pseudaminobacter soli (ex Zhang et al. 2022) TaxID=2831468 RepID=A0A942DY64_9HYPH|nr:DUF1402 family protein [Pseudaminobacter soli]MBS3649756.1 DUF1402 family protein [Pseudaminobacter soli]
MRHLLRTSLIALAIWAVTVGGPVEASAQVPVPPGNRHSEQPPVPGASARRTKSSGSTFERKYRKVYKLLQSDAQLRAKIKEQATAYSLDPIHIVGALVGEHTYNVDAYDRLQTYYVKAVSYLSSKLRFEYGGEDVADFVQRPQFQVCEGKTDSYALWTCRERVWDSEFRGRSVDGQSFPNDRFSATFFQPYYAGQTFGIGQLNPLTALQMSDLVSRVSGIPPLDASNPNKVYETIMDPDLTLAYVAATLKTSIDVYREIAGFDISQNPGITATLYNVGNPAERAHALKAENDARIAERKEPRLPEENYYGWLVNDKLPELKALLD